MESPVEQERAVHEIATWSQRGDFPQSPSALQRATPSISSRNALVGMGGAPHNLCMARVPVRVVCHAIVRVDVVPDQVRRLREQIVARCAGTDARLVEFVVDFGLAKAQPHEYPALNYLRSGAADALLVVSVPVFAAPPPGDLLASKLLGDRSPFAWVSVPQLRREGLLPAAIGPRSFARPRALALRERGFPLDVIARWLDSEGYVAPDGAQAEWVRSDVAKLLREARAELKEHSIPRSEDPSPAVL